MRNYFEEKETRKPYKKNTNSIYYIYWVVMSVLVSALSGSCAYEKPSAAFIGAVFLLIGQLMYPSLERYYGGLGTGLTNVVAQITRYADGIIGVGLFIGCGVNMLLF